MLETKIIVKHLESEVEDLESEVEALKQEVGMLSNENYNFANFLEGSYSPCEIDNIANGWTEDIRNDHQFELGKIKARLSLISYLTDIKNEICEGKVNNTNNNFNKGVTT